jgi:hypothetical protein
MLQTKVVEKIKTHFTRMFNKLFPENHAVYGIIWKNIVEPSRPQMTIFRMRIACWIHKATDTHCEYVIIIVLPRKQWLSLHERATMLRYKYITCLVTSNHNSVIMKFGTLFVDGSLL